MKLSCKVIEDMLPVYADGLCSDETSQLIEDHLRDCPRCGQILAELNSEVALSNEPVDDLKPLADLQKKWKKEQRRSMRKGARITLAVLLAILALWTGVWYFGFAIRYDRLASCLEPITGETALMTKASHTLEYGEYQVVLKKPGFLGGGGFVHIGPREGMVIFLDEDWNEIGQSTEMCVDLFFYPQFGGGYESAVIFDDGKNTWWTWLTPELGYNYDLYNSADAPAEEIAHLESLLEEYHDEVSSLVSAAEELWAIDLFEQK